MPRTDSRGGPETRDRIAATASRLFAEHGFDAVTVTEVGRAAGVSAVTVFKYFPKKEDLFFDRSDEIAGLLLAAVEGRATAAGVLGALRALLLGLLDQQHPVTGVDEQSVAFFRTVAGSSTLIARARQIAADVQHRLASALDAAAVPGDAAMTAAFFIAGYAQILTETAGDLMNGAPHRELIGSHRTRIERLLTALESGPLGSTAAAGHS